MSVKLPTTNSFATSSTGIYWYFSFANHSHRTTQRNIEWQSLHADHLWRSHRWSCLWSVRWRYDVKFNTAVASTYKSSVHFSVEVSESCSITKKTEKKNGVFDVITLWNIGFRLEFDPQCSTPPPSLPPSLQASLGGRRRWIHITANDTE